MQNDEKIEHEENENENDTSDFVTYQRSYVLYKRSDFLGQKKSLSLTYDTDMKIDVY